MEYNIENVPFPTPKLKKNTRREVCCCCGISSTRFPNATFKKIPILRFQKVNKPNNERLKAIAIAKFRRNIFLQRLNVIKKRRNASELKYCNKHQLVEEIFTIPWTSNNKKNKYNEEVCTLLVVQQSSFDKSSEGVINDSIESEEESLVDYSQNTLQVQNKNNKRNNERLENMEAIKKLKSNVQQQSVNLHSLATIQSKHSTCTTKCIFPNCNVKYNQNNVSMMKMPPIYHESKRCNTKNFDRMRIAILNAHRKECLKRLPINENDKRSDIRICNRHELHWFR